MLNVPVDEEFLGIAREIVSEGRSDDEWAEIESDDMFQTDSYEGGYDADEAAFCFSFHAADGGEYWFQLTLDEIEAVARGAIATVSARPAG